MMDYLNRSQELTIVPRSNGSWFSSILHPGDLSTSWPDSQAHSSAVLLEIAPDSWKRREHNWLDAQSQNWPMDAARIASSLGIEPRIMPDGIPYAYRNITKSSPEFFWRSLTVAFVSPLDSKTTIQQWKEFRECVLGSLHPLDWKPPSDLTALLHVDEADFITFVTSCEREIVAWIASQLSAWMGSGSLDTISLFPCADWIWKSVLDVGIRIEELRIVSEAKGPSLRLFGKLGRGSDSLIRDGTIGGELISEAFPIGSGEPTGFHGP